MKKKTGIIICKMLLPVCICCQLMTAAAQWKNPVIDTDFPDPTVVKFGKAYYAYGTQNRSNIQVERSFDLQHWERLPDALPVKPVWAEIHFWAPHVLYDAALKKYVMFYSGESTDTTTGKCLGVAFADQPEGPFTDKGTPLICGEGFINIDPMAITDPKTGKKLLYWGSGFGPLKVQPMKDDWTDFVPGSTPAPLIWPGKEKQYTRLVEGSWVDIHDGKYYLYYSGDNCCGEGANYAVMVARADHPLGPFERYGEHLPNGSSVILEKDSSWLAPGHNSVFTDGKGHTYIAYHAIDRKNPGKGRVMLIRRLVYRNGWPVVR